MTRELSVDFLKLCVAKLDGFFKRFAKFLEDKFAAFVNADLPAILLLIKRYASNAGRIVFHDPLIARIFGSVGKPKILNSIIGRVPIDVINKIWRPIAVKMNPRNAMRAIENSAPDLDIEMPARHQSPGLLASPAGIPIGRHVRALAPVKESGRRIVIKNRANELRRDNRLKAFWHTALRQVRLTVDSTNAMWLQPLTQE